MLLTPRDVDKRLAWPLGRAECLARRGKLTHVLLPDGTIRFRADAVDGFVRDIMPSVQATPPG
jgi:hypothetical protein